MAISPQRLTIYLYSAHRAVIFAIAQLSCSLCCCCCRHCPYLHLFHIMYCLTVIQLFGYTAASVQ